MANNIIVGLDVGTATVNTVVVGVERGKSRPGAGPAESRKTLRILGAGQCQNQGMRRGYVVDFDETVSSIRKSVREAERSAGLPIKRAYISFGAVGLGAERSQATVAVSRADREISEADVKRVVSQSEANLSHFANKQILHTIPLNFFIDRDLKTTKPVGLKGGKLEAEILFIACFNQHYDDLVRSVEAAGVAGEDVVASPLATSKAVLTKRQRETGSLLVDFGAGTVSLAVFEEGIPISLESFPIGSSHITSDIALGFSIPLEDAEILKVSFGSENFSKKKLSEIINARLSDIFELIEGHLKKINRNALLPGGIILTGGGAGLANIAETAKDYLKLPAAVGELKDLAGADKLARSGWATSVGLCLWLAEEKEGLEINSHLPSGIKNVKNSILRWFHSFLP